MIVLSRYLLGFSYNQDEDGLEKKKKCFMSFFNFSFHHSLHNLRKTLFLSAAKIHTSDYGEEKHIIHRRIFLIENASS
jgi:hypothetical protein